MLFSGNLLIIASVFLELSDTKRSDFAHDCVPVFMHKCSTKLSLTSCTFLSCPLSSIIMSVYFVLVFRILYRLIWDFPMENVVAPPRKSQLRQSLATHATN